MLGNRDGVVAKFTPDNPEDDKSQQQSADSDKPVAFPPHERGDQIVSITQSVSDHPCVKTTQPGRQGWGGVELKV